jgi:predicted deacylase
MTSSLTIGTATARTGTIQYGRWEALSHPTGHTEFLPVIIAQGKEEGPCIWLTAGIHGPEQAGPAVIYRLITQKLVDQLRGTIVAIPALNPAGLRTMERRPYHVDDDPNRLWPDGKSEGHRDPDKGFPSSLETAFKRLFASIASSADFLIDYHNSWTGSISFAIRDRILYRTDEDAAGNQAGAEKLAAQLDSMLRAYGHTTVNEFAVDKYIDMKLHRSTSAAALLQAGIPAFTVELGTGHMPDWSIVAAAGAGTRNVLRWAGMLPSLPEQIEGIVVVDAGFPVRRLRAPRVKQACVALHLLEGGDRVGIGDPVAELYDIWGRPLEESQLLSMHDGLVLGRSHGIYYYPGAPLYSLAIRDEADLIAPYPEEYYRD